ncbi:MAG: hypothetical protein ACXVIB_06145 [Halobacteriota archaeon]
MTLAIGVNFGAYVLLAADIRTTYYDWNSRTIAFRDGLGEIQKTDLGLIAAAGYVDLLDCVERRLAQQTITSTSQVLTIINEETQRYQSRHGGGVAYYIEQTGWIFSYTTVHNGAPKLRLAKAHIDNGRRVMELYQEHDPAVVYPAEATTEQAQDVYDALTEGIEPFEQSNSVDTSIKHHWTIVMGVMRAYARMFPSVSSYLQIGIRTLDRRIAVSPIVKDTEKAVSLDFDGD